MTEPTKRERVLDVIRGAKGPCSVQHIKEQMRDQFGYASVEDVSNCLSALTINDRSRHHNGAPQDLLIKARVRGTTQVRYWLYDRATDGPKPHTASEDLDWTYNRVVSE